MERKIKRGDIYYAKLLFMVVFQQNTKHSYLHWKISYNGMMTK